MNAMVPPNKYNQYESIFNLGNATSAAPICNGIITLAKPTNSGVANIKSMMVPCMVNIWLYCSLLKNCIPGRANSPRRSKAIKPAIKNQVNEVIKYRYPIVL